jgi:hypothetical protein
VTSLKKYEALKPITAKLRIVKDSLLSTNKDLHHVIVLQDTALHQMDRVVAYKDILYLDQKTKAEAYKKKATARLFTSIGLGALAVLFAVLAVQ